jgi:hypothetical protein
MLRRNSSSRLGVGMMSSYLLDRCFEQERPAITNQTNEESHTMAEGALWVERSEASDSDHVWYEVCIMTDDASGHRKRIKLQCRGSRACSSIAIMRCFQNFSRICTLIYAPRVSIFSFRVLL